MEYRSYMYPHVWEDIYAKQKTYWETYCNGIPSTPAYIDFLWSLTWAYQAFQLKSALDTARQEKQAKIERERKKTGYITKRVAPAGYVAVTKPLARKIYEQGKDVTICGGNVQSFHIFHGWRLGCTISTAQENKTNYSSEPIDFDDIIHSYLFHLDRELGTYAVYYVKYTDILTSLTEKE